jgi:ribonuclease P protein component
MANFITLRKNSEYKKVYVTGRSVANRFFVIFEITNSLNNSRFGFSVGKKIGKAVLRNRIRRLLKEICRLNNDIFPVGYDFVILARKDVVTLNFDQMKNHLAKLVLKLSK